MAKMMKPVSTKKAEMPKGKSTQQLAADRIRGHSSLSEKRMKK